MLTSKKLELRRSEIRQSLAELANIETPSDDEVRKMGDLDTEYRAKEAQYRAALVSEDEERREAGAELETRDGKEWSDLIGGFELRQVAMALDTGHQIEGRTAEVVTELRRKGGFQGVPIPWEALETRATVSSGTSDPISTRPIIDRLFPNSVAAQMGAQMIAIDSGEVEWPVVTQGAAVGWAATEGGDIAAPQAFQTTDKAMAPDNTLGVRMAITRRAMKQSGAALEQAVRRDMNSAMAVEMDRVVFLGSGASGQPLGVIAGASTYGITETAIDAAADFDMVVDALTRFMVASAANPGSINMMIRPEVWSVLMKAKDGDGNFLELVERIRRDAGRVVVSNNGLAAPSGDPAASNALLTTSTGGVAPIFVGRWGPIDVVRDIYTDAASGGLRLTALATLDTTVARPAQLEILTGVQ